MAPRIKLLAGIHAGELNGIDTYAEQVAVAGAAAGHDVTLLATSAKVAGELTRRVSGAGVTVIHLGLTEPSRNQILAERFFPAMAVRRVSRAVDSAMAKNGVRYQAAHLNRPPLGSLFHPFAERVCVAAWFYPHAPIDRVRETWRHTSGGGLPRRVVLATKSLGFYRLDELGYRTSDRVVAPTEILARQLREQGFASFVCPPPVRVLDRGGSGPPRRGARDPKRVKLVVCSGDLGHPRKNLAQAVRALAHLARSGRAITLQAIGKNPEALQRVAATLPAGVSLELTGPLPPREVHERMREADALVLPSLYEEWGYVAVESLLCGTPVVAYPMYPFAEMLSDGLGVVARDMNARGLAEAIERALAGECRPDLAEAAAARFGSAAIGARLTPVWAGAA